MPHQRRAIITGGSPSWAAPTVIVAALAIGVAGCGGSKAATPKAPAEDSAKASITKVIAQLQEASVAGDGKRICNDIFSPKLADSVTKSAKSGSCAKEVKAKLFSPTTQLTTQGVTVSDPANAVATIKEANGNVSKVFFVLQSGIWRIRSVQAS